MSDEHENQMNEEIVINQDTDRPTNNPESTPTKPKKFNRLMIEQDNIPYYLDISIVGKNLKLLLTEQVNFPAKSYEVYLALDELKLKNDLFAIYNSIEELFAELSAPEDKLTYNIKKKEGGVIALVIAFLVEEENNYIEIDLNENIIDDREMFRQLYEKYKSIQREQEEDIAHFMSRINAIEEILAPPKEEHVPEQNEEQGEEHMNGEEHEQHSENMVKEEATESNKGLTHESLEIKSSHQESTNSIQKGKNVKKSKVVKKKEIKKENKKEEKGKVIKKKKK
jgi:hypothetical protein